MTSLRRGNVLVAIGPFCPLHSKLESGGYAKHGEATDRA